MSDILYTVNGIIRTDDQQGKGASRRLRKQNLVPAIIYGGNEEPTTIAIKNNELWKLLENEAFFSNILTIKLDGQEELAVIKDLQRHPSKGFPMHADFQRIVKGEKINMNIPVHFVGRETAPGVKAGGILSTLVTDIEIVCLPQDLPEYLEVDVSELEIGESLHLTDRHQLLKKLTKTLKKLMQLTYLLLSKAVKKTKANNNSSPADQLDDCFRAVI